jgi:serine phosphatase RsbU (regulator of sigma subunit)
VRNSSLDKPTRALVPATSAPQLEPAEWRRARAVHDRFFPQSARFLDLECTGITLPAAGVGGDLYDFLKIGARRVGLVLADVAGHGLASALLMATLRATLRSDYDLVREDLGTRLARLNRTLHASTAPEEYATLFLGEYEGPTRKLRYVNCGHVAPALLQSDGRILRLESTATALGLFEAWSGDTGVVDMAPGDLLVLLTDGIVEACNHAGDEFGDDRVLALADRLRFEPLERIQRMILAATARFSEGRQDDDRTMVLTRPRALGHPMKLRRV